MTADDARKMVTEATAVDGEKVRTDTRFGSIGSHRTTSPRRVHCKE